MMLTEKNWILTKKAKLRVEKKKKKRKYVAEHRTHANPPPKAHTQKAQQAAGMRECNRSPP